MPMNKLLMSNLYVMKEFIDIPESEIFMSYLSCPIPCYACTLDNINKIDKILDQRRPDHITL